MESSEIQFWDRQQNKLKTEKVYGDQSNRFLYQSSVGRALTDHVLVRPWISQVVGVYQSSALSKHRIPSFIQKFQIDMNEYEKGPFSSFNEFFIRKFVKGARPFVEAPQSMPAPCEGRYLGFEKITPDLRFPVKGQFLTAFALLENQDLAKKFEGGPLLIARLCPVDYHRFHFPDDGEKTTEYRVRGKYHSVNPRALEYRGDIFSINERHISLLETKNFGTIAFIEVGALCVGKIIQSSRKNSFQRGEEKGYFLFGGSTVILMGEAGRWKIDSDLISETQKRRECFVRLGEKIATAQ